MTSRLLLRVLVTTIALQAPRLLLGATTTFLNPYDAPLSGTIPAGTLIVTEMPPQPVITYSQYPTLNAATVLANVQVGPVPHSGYGYLRVQNGTTFLGSSFRITQDSIVFWEQTGTLANQQILSDPGSAISITSTLSATEPSTSSLTLAATTTASNAFAVGGMGQFTNLGTIDHYGSQGRIVSRTVVNSGLIKTFESTLTLGSAFAAGATFENTASGTIRVSGTANVSVALPAGTSLINRGLVDVQGGRLTTNGQLTNAAGGTLQGGGAITGAFTVAGGTIAPGNGVGTLTVDAGSMTVTGPAVFAAEINGASADRLVFNNALAPIDLGSGLLTLSLTLLNTPTNNPYSIIVSASGSSSIMGAFVNAPNNGDRIGASFGGVGYEFAVGYGSSAVTLQLVPEPPVSLLVALGSLGLAAARWRMWRSRRP